jgi:DNA-binding transcriptional ArsR family regulator
MAPGPEAARVPGDVDSQHIAAIMRALANPVRIDLLKAIQSAKPLGEIRLEARRRDRVARPGRPMNRVTARQHLDILLEAGMARRVRRVRDGRALDHYVVNQAQIFALLEELRQLVLIRPQGDVVDGTVPVPTPADRSAAGARLALVNGVGEGQVFALAGPGLGRWGIGRRPGNRICLEHDPYVSLDNSELARRGRGYAVRDLGSRNGTFVNWERLASEEWRPLATGDLLGVGRSALVFREA